MTHDNDKVNKGYVSLWIVSCSENNIYTSLYYREHYHRICFAVIGFSLFIALWEMEPKESCSCASVLQALFGQSSEYNLFLSMIVNDWFANVLGPLVQSIL